MKLVKSLWIITAVVFIGSLITFLVIARNNILDHDWWSPTSLVGGLFWYGFSGWCLITLPFAIAAIIASLTVKGKLSNRHKVALWLVVGLALFFLYLMANFGYRE